MTFIQGSGNLRLAVKLPEGEDLNEWLAVHGELVGPFASLHQWDHHPPSRRFLQPPQHALRHGDGVLHPSGGPSSPCISALSESDYGWRASQCPIMSAGPR